MQNSKCYIQFCLIYIAFRKPISNRGLLFFNNKNNILIKIDVLHLIKIHYIIKR